MQLNIDYTILISDQCDAGVQRCEINDNYSGVCRRLNYYNALSVKFPGEKCSYPSWTEECRYGTQKCEDGVCESVGHNRKCSESRDCPSHQYCAGSSGTSFDGTCTKFKEIGQECTHRYECGRTATCWYRNTYSGVNGRCKDYFQISSGDSTNKIWNEFGTYTQNEADSHLLCQSQYYNTDTGICEDGNLSLEKGKECTADTDCPSDKTGVFAKCSCGWSSTAGDEEWEDARTAFKTYFDATKNDCNVASRWGECNDPKLYKDRRCKKLKAENYAYLLHNKTELSCMETLK
ncbi:unnamed protein product [Moneuplotes crassus]|uniref:Uncharacterized protein n=1 Tax=Euplotes crassus TaxID=5936 RepID=A0AAD1US97_EUPCR|nr:unnamed protein product [Moneuplotes crassus]